MKSEPTSIFLSTGSPTTSLSNDEVRSHINSFLAAMGTRHDVLLLPPDFTRFHSQAGMITKFICEYYNFIPHSSDDKCSDSVDDAVNNSQEHPVQVQIIPALGTHAPMTHSQTCQMFGPALAHKTPSPFIVHNWRSDVVTIGHAPSSMVEQATRGIVSEKWPAQLNKLIWEKRRDLHDQKDGSLPPLVISIGQVVPHEVMGMANFNKNLFVGTGGVESINLSHFIGAVYGMEKLMGRAHNPLRSILNYCSEQYLGQLDLWYVLTVMGANDYGEVEMKGLYIGNDVKCYDDACDLSLKVNFNLLEKAPKKIVVYLNEEYHSTWLGNKSIYRTRMAIDDGGELIVLAPWVDTFGEDQHIDELIRKVGYVGTPQIMKAMENDSDLKNNLSAVAHLIHGSSEGRFSITYCPGHLTQREIEGVGFKYANLIHMKQKYDIETLKDGWNIRVEDGKEEEFFYISNPALGLWAVPSRFEDESTTAHQELKNGPDSSIGRTDQVASDRSGGVGGWKHPPKEDEL